MKKIIVGCLLVVGLLFLQGCSGNNKGDVIKVGITGTGTIEVWEHVKDVVEKDGINLEIVVFSDYTQPNLALAQGEIDINSFQHQAFLDGFVKDNNVDLVAIGQTFIAPLGIYSSKITDVNELVENAKVSIPNDATNGGRALQLLESAGLIKLKDGVALPTVRDVIENRLNLDIIELDASQTARSLGDVAIACINSGVAVDAGFIPVEDSIFLEAVNENSEPFINIIVARGEDKDNEVYAKIVEAFQTDATKEVIARVTKGSSIPVW